MVKGLIRQVFNPTLMGQVSFEPRQVWVLKYKPGSSLDRANPTQIYHIIITGPVNASLGRAQSERANFGFSKVDQAQVKFRSAIFLGGPGLAKPDPQPSIIRTLDFFRFFASSYRIFFHFLNPYLRIPLTLYFGVVMTPNLGIPILPPFLAPNIETILCK